MFKMEQCNKNIEIYPIMKSGVDTLYMLPKLFCETCKLWLIYSFCYEIQSARNDQSLPKNNVVGTKTVNVTVYLMA